MIQALQNILQREWSAQYNHLIENVKLIIRNVKLIRY